MKVNEKMKKALSILLCFCMLISYVPMSAHAVGTCDHHTEHTAECGYVAAVAGADCTHVCGDDCAEGCTHTHDDACGYVEAVAGHECHYECNQCAEEEEEAPSERGLSAELTGGESLPTTESLPQSPTATAPSSEGATGAEEDCTCGTDDAAVHATDCPAYVAPEMAVCTCVEQCMDANVWCDVCGFDVTACTGEDTATAYTENAVASVTISGTTTYYETLAEAATAAQTGTEAAPATLKLEQSIDLGKIYLRPNTGVFTFDLNGKTLSGSQNNDGTLAIEGGNVTITDTVGGGTITSSTYAGVTAYYGCTVTIEGGTISGEYYGVDIYESTVIINGGTISNTATSTTDAAVNLYSSTVTINGGTITGALYDLYNCGDSTIILGLGEDGVGATFPGGLSMTNDETMDTILTLNTILGEDVAYWQGDKMIFLTDGQMEIPDGDVTVKAECKHENATIEITETQHKITCSCGYDVTENHSFENGKCTACGAEKVQIDTVTVTDWGSDNLSGTAISPLAITSDGTLTGNMAGLVLYVTNDDSRYVADHELYRYYNNYNGWVFLSGGKDGTQMLLNDKGFDYIAYSPYMITTENSEGDSEDTFLYNMTEFSVPTDGNYNGGWQNQTATYYNPTSVSGSQYDLLWGKGTSTGESAKLTPALQHALTMLVVNVTGYGTDVADGVTVKEVTIGGTVVTGTLNLTGANSAAEVVTVSGETATNITAAQFDTAVEQYEALIIPQTAEITVTFTMSDGSEYQTTLESQEWASGTQYTLDLQVGCKHEYEYTANDDGTTHKKHCTVCEKEENENHSFSETGLCGICKTQAVASTTIGGTTTYHLSLGDAITAVANCTATDNAVVKLLDNVDLGKGCQEITSGVFTLDLNGFTLSSENEDYKARTLYINGNSVQLTITDNSEEGNGEIVGNTGITVDVEYGSVTVSGGTIRNDFGGGTALRSYEGNITITGGAIDCDADVMEVSGGSLTITGGSFTSDYRWVKVNNCNAVISGGVFSVSVSCWGGNLTITGGSITGYAEDYDYADLILGNEATITLDLADSETVGATFPGGLELYVESSSNEATLNGLLADGVAYWQDGKMIVPADDATEITGGDVTIKAECNHEGNTNTEYTDNGDGTHSLICSVCGAAVDTAKHSLDYTDTEGTTHTVSCSNCNYKKEAVEHTYDDGRCDCGKVCNHKDNTNEYTTTDDEHSFTCSVCKKEVSGSHEPEYSASGAIITASCTVCDKELVLPPSALPARPTTEKL